MLARRKGDGRRVTLKDLPWELNNWKMDWKTPKMNGAVGSDLNRKATRIFCPWDNGLLLSHRRSKRDSVLVSWKNLEPVIQSEVSQKEKNKYHILTYI